MIVLSRKRDEELVLTVLQTGLTFAVRVEDIRGDKVRLGVEADIADVQVDRREVWESKQAEIRAAAGACSGEEGGEG